MTNDPEPRRKRGLLATLAAMKPLDEAFPEIEDLPAEPVDPWPEAASVERSADWPFLREGAVTLFWRKELFESARRQLLAAQYDLFVVSCLKMQEFRGRMSEALRWTEQFGYEPWTGNLDALNDGFRTVPFGPSRKFGLCLEDFDALVRSDARLAQGVLDIIEYNARDHLLSGCRLLALVQTNDPDYDAQNLGARHANWNRDEWLISARTIGPST